MSQLTLEELELLDEPKYRNYINSIDKALKNFEYTSEWADLIAALGKLNKVSSLIESFMMLRYNELRFTLNCNRFFKAIQSLMLFQDGWSLLSV